MRKALICFLFSVLSPVTFHALAQESDAGNLPKPYLEFLQQRDSILIGDQMEYGFTLEGLVKGTSITCLGFPESSVEIIEGWTLDTMQNKKRAGHFDVKASVRIAAFEEGRHKLPQIKVEKINPNGMSDTILFAPVDIEVTTVPVDTAAFVRHDMKPMIEVPYEWNEFMQDILEFWIYCRDRYLGWIIFGRWVIILLIAAYCIHSLSVRRNDVQRRYVNEPAHIVAMRKLDGLRSNAMWVPEKQKVFYSGVTDALREYISRRYGICAMEMTTAELFAVLNGTDLSKEQLEELQNLFERADFVKFAKFVASDEDNASTVPVAVRFVTQTYQSDLLAQQEQFKEEEEKKN